MKSDSDASPSPARISLMTATMLVVANMIGTGIFGSLGFQVAGLPSGFAILFLWVIGGVLAFCGAVCYAELSAQSPRSGGEYHLLGYAYHPIFGFLTGWISVTVGFAAPIALNAYLFGTYFGGVFDPIIAQQLPEFLHGLLTPTRLAILVVLLITFVHLRGIRTASRFQVVFTTGKVLLVIGLIIAGFCFATPQGDTRFLPASGDLQLILSPAFALSLYWVAYAYTGWNAAAYVVGEMENPRRNLPLALFIGTGLVTVLYVALNAAFLYTTPRAAMENQPEVGFIAAQHMFGDFGGQIMGLLICFGLLSTISAMVWAGPRVTQVMGEDYRSFGFLSHRTKAGAPSLAIIVQSTIVVILLWTMTFEQTLFFIQALLTLSSLLVVVAVFWVRWKDPGAKRPYSAFGYPVTPIIFAVMSLYMLVYGVWQMPMPSLLGLATLVVGFGVYWLASLSNRGKPQSRPSAQ